MSLGTAGQLEVELGDTTVTAAQVHAARIYVAANCPDAADILDALGIDGDVRLVVRG